MRENNHLGAPAVSTPRTCEETGGKMKLGGPFWSAPIHNVEIVNELLNRLETPNSTPYPVPTLKRLTGLLTCVSEEVSNAPFYYSLSVRTFLIRFLTLSLGPLLNPSYEHNTDGSYVQRHRECRLRSVKCSQRATCD